MARRDDRIAEEIAFHIEQQTAKHIAAGMSPEDASARGPPEVRRRRAGARGDRDELRGAWLRDFARDLRIACRSLARVPSFSVTAILTIGLGIGAAAAMFSVIDGVLLRPLPYPEADRIVQLFQIGDKGTRGANVSEPNFLDWQAQTRGFAAMAETTVFPQTVLGAGEPQSVPVAMVSQGFFDVMGTRPARGRGFLPGELQRGAAPVALVGARFWERWKGDRPLCWRIDRHRRRGPRRGRRHAARVRLPPRGGDLDPARAGLRVAVAHRAQLPRRRAGPARDRHPGGLCRAEPRLARDEGPLRQRDDDGRRRRRPHPRRDDRRRPPGAAAAAGGLGPAAARGVHQRLEPAGGAGGVAAARVRRPARTRCVGGADDAPVAGRDDHHCRRRRGGRRRPRGGCGAGVRRHGTRQRAAAGSGGGALAGGGLRRRRRRLVSPSSSACSPPGAPAASGSPTPCRTAHAAAPAAGGRCGPASCSSSRRWR